MSRSHRKRVLRREWDELETRWLLAAPQIPGNVGQVISSQFQPFGFKTTVGTQIRDVRLRGPFKIDVTTPFPTGDSGSTSLVPPINSGLIAGSQFNGGGFHTVGVQLDRVRLGHGLTISGFDNENPTPTLTATTQPALINRGLILNSQFNDRGFGVVERTPDGRVVAREGRVGLQWRKVHVHGPVNIGIEDLVIQPGADNATAALSATPAASNPAGTVVDLTTNIGRIRDSQFNDGGFGDIGMQWLRVNVRGHVGTSTNTLFIKPKQDNLGPITIKDLVFGQSAGGTDAQASARASVAAGNSVSQPSRAVAHATAQDPGFQTTYTNSATNSGRIVRAQFNDGGFGDIGLQWKNVRVGGSVTAVHNSLTVQPENNGQGLITVQGIQFPTKPKAPRRTPTEPLHTLPDDPPVVANDGEPVELPPPTGPLGPFFPTPFGGIGTVTFPFPGNFPLVNSASNSGLILGGQFNAGGFGDDGLQWKDVRVGGDVQLVHNSLSVHPEGSKLEGISVSDVSYGPPISRRVARHLKVLPYAVISTGTSSSGVDATTSGGQVLHPPNDRWLTNQQLAVTDGTDVFLQWNGIEHHRGLVVVHNIIKLSDIGPTTGPITLINIRFPFRVPPFAPLTHVSVQPAASADAPSRAVSVSDEPRGLLLNAANNSGILSHSQFTDEAPGSDPGAGDRGDDLLQWRHVGVRGSVAVVHNQLAVDESSDLPDGDVPGPITISNITFNSGALDAPLSRRYNQLAVSPPDMFQRVSSRPVNLGRPLPHIAGVVNEATNSGILAGGQLASHGANHVALQWQGVKVNCRVTVVDNVLSISMKDRPSGPITISNVTFA